MTVNGTSVTAPRGDVSHTSASCLGTVATSSVAPSVAGQDKIQPDHLERLAIVYVRQSTPQQVLKHRESTDLQIDAASRLLPAKEHGALLCEPP